MAAVSPRQVARRVLERVEKDGAWATPTLDGELARAGLDDRDRRLASELVYGVLRHKTRIDRALAAHAQLKKTPPRVLLALRVAAYQLLFLDRVPAYAAVDDAVGAAREAGGQKLAGFANAVLRKLGAAKEPALPAGGRDRLEVQHSLPGWILDELVLASDGDDAAVAVRAAAFAEPAPIVARINRRKTTRDAVAAELASDGVTTTPIDIALPASLAEGRGASGAASALESPPAANESSDTPAASSATQLDGVGRAASGPPPAPSSSEPDRVGSAASGTPAALRLDGLGDPARSSSFIAGRWTVQDSGAQLVAEVAAPRVGQRILDACAGVGGKSTHLAELTDDASPIDSADLNATKLGLLDETARRLGLTSIRRHTVDLLDPGIWSATGAGASSPNAIDGARGKLAASYDLIILDAPCSGLGVLRRHPDAKWRLKPGDVTRLADLQRQLLDALAPHLAPGGTFVYSVCTFTRAEGPEQAAAFAARHGLRIVGEHRSWPPDADAFYIARLARD